MLQYHGITQLSSWQVATIAFAGKLIEAMFHCCRVNT